MTGLRRRLAAAIGCVIAIGLAAARPANAQTPPPVFQTWLNSLQAQGYTVTQGTAYQFTPSYCQQVLQPVFATCFSSDPTDPYIVPELPVGTTYIDPSYGTPTAATTPAGVLTDQFWRLATTDAMLVIVNLPPLGAYFSYQSYLFGRPVAQYARTGFAKRTPDPLRAEIFGSFNNSIDNVTIERQSGLTFGQGTVAFITTPNAALAGNLATAFSAAGGSPSLLFTEAMGTMVKPGPYKSNDDFITVMRYSVANNTTAGDSWRSATAANIQVYRITQPAGLPVSLYGATPLRAKAAGASELGHSATLTELTQLLTTWLASQEPGVAVAAHATLNSEQLSRKGVPQTGEVGPYCIANGTVCASDSQDTDDYKTFQMPAFADNRIMIVDGVDHAIDNDSTYYSVSFEDLQSGTGTVSAFQTNLHAAGFTSGVLTGSAATVLQDLGLTSQASAALQADLPNLFVHLFTRPCDPGAVYCLKPYTSTISDTDIPANHPVEMLERAYVLPGYPNGANPASLLNPFIVY